MLLKLYNKKQIVKQINETATKAISLIIADTSGISVNEITKLRESCRKTEDIHLYSTRNSLLIRGIKNTYFGNIINIIKGQCIIAFSFKNPYLTTKVFNEFSKEINKTNFIKGVFLENKIFNIKDIDILISLPDREGAFRQLIFVFKYISIVKLYFLLLLLQKKKLG